MAKNIQQIIENYNEAPPTETMNAQRLNRNYVPGRADKRVLDLINKPGNRTQNVAYDELKKEVIKKKDKKRSRTNKVVKGQVKRAQKIKDDENALVQAIVEHIEEMDATYNPPQYSTNDMYDMKTGKKPVDPITYEK